MTGERCGAGANFHYAGQLCTRRLLMTSFGSSSITLGAAIMKLHESDAVLVRVMGESIEA